MDENRVMGCSAQDEPYLTSLAANETKCAVYITDAAANIIYVNRIFTEMLGYQPHEVVGRRAREILGSVHYSEAVYARMWEDLRRNRPVQDEVPPEDFGGGGDDDIPF